MQLCIMSGCDFLPSLPGIGIKRAHAHLQRTRCFIKVGDLDWWWGWWGSDSRAVHILPILKSLAMG